MKITGIDIYGIKAEVPEDWKYPLASFIAGGSLIIKINTDEGISGWGEPSPYGAPFEVMLSTLKEQLRPYLIGKDPHNVSQITSQDETKSKHIYGQAAWSSAMAGVSQALWDIIGKVKNKPLYEILTDQEITKNSIQLYASGGMTYESPSSLEQLIEEAKEFKSKGFKNWKFRPPSPKSNLSHFERNKNPPKIDLNFMIDASSKLRDVLGDEFGLMTDVGCRLSNIKDAITFGKVLDELDFKFFEEPLKRNSEEYNLLKNQIKTPVGIGECFFSSEQFQRWIADDAVDTLQPDANFAGITEILKISNLAKKNQKEMILHNWTNPISMAANAHLAVAIPECSMLEYSVILNPMRTELINNPFTVENGELFLPKSPGLGIKIDEVNLKKFCFLQDIQK